VCESLKIRRWLRQLIRSSLLQGTIEHGAWVHDLVRDTMIARCEASQGGLVAMQRHTAELLLAAASATSQGSSQKLREYTVTRLAHHVARAIRPQEPLHMDGLVLTWLRSEDESVHLQACVPVLSRSVSCLVCLCLHAACYSPLSRLCVQVAISIGVERLRTAIDVCEGQWQKVAMFSFAIFAVDGSRATREASLTRAMEAIRKLRAGEQALSVADRSLKKRCIDLKR
jgi:hypothetical protein